MKPPSIPAGHALAVPCPLSPSVRGASRRLLRVLAVAALAGGVVASALGQTTARPIPSVDVTDRLIVKYRQPQAPAAASAAGRTASLPAPATAAARKGRLDRALGASTFRLAAEKTTSFGAQVVSLGRSAKTEEVRQLGQRLMADDPDIEYAVPDRFIYLAHLPADPRYAQQWPLHDAAAGVRAPGAWRLFDWADAQGRRDRDFPLVAVIDTGYRPHVDLVIPDLGADYLTGAAMPLDTGDARTAGQCENIPSAADSSWHGLAVEGIIAARLDNGAGIAGLAPQGAGIVHARVFGPCGGYLSAYIAAIHDVVDFRNARGQRVRVINLSQSGASPCEAPLQAEISRAVDAGVVVVASAGNSATDVTGSSPANCTGAISVAATDRFGNLAYYSNHGAGLTLSAPGGDSYTRAFTDGVLTTSLNLRGTEPTGQQASDYTHVQGTSFSAPHVSAAAALLVNLDPSLTAAEVRDILVRTARPLRGTCPGGCGAGLLDVRKAVALVEKRKIKAALCARFPYALPICRSGLRALDDADGDD
jgi:serine protease